jgi:uncharacterized protein (TIGR02145 family)
MKNLIIKFVIILFAFVIFLGCKEGTIKEKADSTINDQKSSAEIDTVKTPVSPMIIPTIKIGQQEWMTEDISTKVYNNGDPIYEAKSEKQWEKYGKNKIGCYIIHSSGTYLYNGYAVNDKRGIIPTGFILPTYNQFNRLIQFLGGGESDSGPATRSMATYIIHSETVVGNEEAGDMELVPLVVKPHGRSGFKAKKGGHVYDNGSISHQEGCCSYWWTASSEGKNIISVDIGYCSQDLGGGRGSYPATFGFAVRAIKEK